VAKPKLETHQTVSDPAVPLSGGRSDVEASPPWGNNVKLIVGLTLMAILAGLLIRFRNLIGPLLVAFILAFLLHPIAGWLQKRLNSRWRLSVNLVYLVLLILLIGSLTWGGFALVEQVQNLISFVQRQIAAFPAWFDRITATPLAIGPFTFDLSQFDLGSLGDQVLGMAQTILGQLGNVVGSIAGGAASLVGWSFFALLVSYFVTSETGGVRSRLLNIQVPGYADDFSRIGRELGRIWNAFLRGQLILMLLAIAIYSVYLGIWGVRFYFGLAILAGLSRFVPYVGAWVTWITYALVCLFQGDTALGLTPFFYAALVLGGALLIDTTMDNYVTPSLMADTLAVHPAAVMVAALISAQLFGLIGVVLAAPTLATLQLGGRYILRKLFDQDPWAGMKVVPPPKPLPRIIRRLGLLWRKFIARFRKNRAPDRP